MQILEAVQSLYALGGEHTTSMRSFAKALDTTPSVLYHYFSSKDMLLYQMYRHTSYQLGQLRKQRPFSNNPTHRFRQLIHFQFQHAELIVALLKFYLEYRESFAQSHHKTLPAETNLHIQEMIEHGIAVGRYHSDAGKHAQIITHAINGYLLEHYPHTLSRQKLQQLVDDLADFLEQPLLA